VHARNLVENVMTRLPLLVVASALTVMWAPVTDCIAQAAASKKTSLAPPSAPVVAGEPVAVVGHPEPLSLLRGNDPALDANKRLVFDLWRSVVNAGRVEIADQLLTEGYIQHSPVLPTGRAAFKKIFSSVPRREKIPELIEPPLIAFVAERDLVVMTFVEKLPNPDGSGTYATTHFNMFRIANGRLAEHWHSIQLPPGADLPAPEKGGPQRVSGASGIAQLMLLDSADPELANNKRLVFDMWRHVVDAGREEMADLYLRKDFIQHNPNVATGRDAFKTYFSKRNDLPVETTIRAPLVAMIAEGDLVVQATMLEHPHPSRAGETYTTTWFDMFRVTDGRLAEHWDAATQAAQ
jgi:predicted SnoaL-like aldol condensation-catalyzing enzyme